MAKDMTVEQLREHVRTKVPRAYRTQERLAELTGVSTSYLSDFLSGKCDPGPKLLRALGAQRVVKYRLVRI